MNEKLFELIEKFIDAKIEYQFAINEVDEEGYRSSAPNEAKKIERLKKDIIALAGCIKHSDSICK
jgi:hypothetical protein